MQDRKSRLLVAAGVAVFLVIIFVQMFGMARANSANFDEGYHVYAGYLQWKHGYETLNPPLVTMLITLPILSMDLPEPKIPHLPYEPLGFEAGRELLFKNDAETILFRVRMVASIFTLLLALLVFAAAREMFGVGAGFVALGLLAFDPNLMGHSAVATLDSGNALFMFAAMYSFYRYMKEPSWWKLAGTSVLAGLALAAKHSAIMLFPSMVLLAAIEVVWRKRLEPEAPAVPMGKLVGRLALALGVMGAVGFVMLWGSYWFKYAQSDAVPFIPSMAEQIQRVPSALNAKVLTLIDQYRLLPAPWTYAFAYILYQATMFSSYVWGVARHHAVWYYFPFTMLVKSSLTFLALLGIGVFAVATRRLRVSRGVLYTVVPAAVFLLAAMTGGMNIGVRHILPVYVFLTVPMAGAAWALAEKNRGWLGAVAVLLLFQAVSVVQAYPGYVSYANEAFGGPDQVYRYLSDSSAEFGQQLKSVKRYLDERGVKKCYFAYFNEWPIGMASYGVPCTPLYTGEVRDTETPAAIDGPVLISTTTLSGFETGVGELNPYQEFQSRKPAAVIDHGVFVYEGHFEIPLVSALSLVGRSQGLLRKKDAAGALELARQAEKLAPGNAEVNEMVGQALEVNGQREEALGAYRKALEIAKRVQPEWQVRRIKALEKKLGAWK